MTVSFAKDIAALFTDGDARCMGGMGVHLREYDYMANPAGDAVFADYASTWRAWTAARRRACRRAAPAGTRTSSRCSPRG